LSFVMAILIPGPVIMRAWVVWPLFTASNTYLPALKELLERAMWKSVSVSLTVVELVDAEAGAADRTVAATVAPEAAASATSGREATRLTGFLMEGMVVLCGRCCSDVTMVHTGQMGPGIEPWSVRRSQRGPATRSAAP